MKRRLVVSRALATISLLVLPLLVIALSQHQQPKKKSAVTKHDVQQLIDQLGSADEREQFQAEERLISLSRKDDRIEPLLKAALQNTTESHHARVRQTLHNIKVCRENGD